MNDEVKKYVEEQKAAGFDDEAIKQALVQAGYTPDVINSLFEPNTQQDVVQQNTSNLSQSKMQPEQDTAEVSQIATNPQPTTHTPKKKHRWVKWVIGAFVLIGLVFLTLYILSRPLPEGSNALKNRALDTLIEKGDEVFTENGEVNAGGLCVFMVFNASYKEAVSDPTWEFQCFDSDDAYAGEVKLNDGTYHCRDSQGNDVKGATSLIYGPECLEEGDERLNDNQTFTTSYVFYESQRVKKDN